MLGLFTLGVIGIWVFGAVKLSTWAFRNTEPLSRRRVKTGVAMAVFLVTPVADEVIGGFQLYGFCRANGAKEEQFADIAGTKVIVTRSGYTPVKGSVLEVRALKVNYSDRDSGRILFAYTEYRSKGGWIAKALGSSSDPAPIIFGRSCSAFGIKPTQIWLGRYQISTELAE